MSKFISDYINTIEKEMSEVENLIVEYKRAFGSTEWDDAKSMIMFANEIWRLEKRLKDTKEIHNIILENYRTGI